MSNSISSFCSVLSMSGSEPISGSAISDKRYVFISYPKKYWARKQFESKGFPQQLTDYLNQIQREQHITTRLIYRHGETKSDESTIIVMPDGIKFEAVKLEDIRETLEHYFDEKLGATSVPEKIVVPHIFCCTHGKRDKCCAKFGQEIASEIDSVARMKGFALSVWECTHLGADRFAANSLSFPSRFMFGRMRIENVPQIIESLIREVPYSPCYRGRLGTDATYQVAEAFGFNHAFVNNLSNPEIIVESATEQIDSATKSFVVKVLNRNSQQMIATFALTIEKRLYPTFVDCDGLAKGNKKSLPRWVVTRVELLPLEH